MKLIVPYFENNIELSNDKVFSIEIENKQYFYRFINNLFDLKNDILIDNFIILDELKEININGKINILVDFFNFDSIFKSYTTNIIKYIINNINDNDKINYTNEYEKLLNKINKNINDLELPIKYNFELNFENIIKMYKPSINIKDNLLDNLLIVADLEKELKINKFIVLVNVKQFLNKEELKELYKYYIYNDLILILVDSQSYGVSNIYENKLIIDGNLDEIMIK